MEIWGDMHAWEICMQIGWVEYLWRVGRGQLHAQQLGHVEARKPDVLAHVGGAVS